MRNYISETKDSIQRHIFTPAFGSITGQIVQTKMFEILDAIQGIIGSNYRDLERPITDILLELLDAPTISGGAEFKGEFADYGTAMEQIGDFETGDFFIVKSNFIPKSTELYIYSDEWVLVSKVLEGLEIIKNPNNYGILLETNDYGKGWINNNIFVDGIWLGTDNPTQTQINNKENWSNFIEF